MDTSNLILKRLPLKKTTENMVVEKRALREALREKRERLHILTYF